jgi:hypothetical protein
LNLFISFRFQQVVFKQVNPIQIKFGHIGHIHMVSRCYLECSEMLVLLVPTV